jgi:hypothetical protein
MAKEEKDETREAGRELRGVWTKEVIREIKQKAETGKHLIRRSGHHGLSAFENGH